MSVEVGDIKIFTLLAGIELIGKVTAVNSHGYSLDKVYAISATPKDGGGVNVQLMPISPFALDESKDGAISTDIYFSNILLTLNPPLQLIEHHAKKTGSIITPPREKKILHS